ncbi:MAG: DNA-3-methyladenine glycosylase [Cyclobacteriaceae bacterium]|jgi:DNA-3-methyladenine glycosylase
MNDKYVKLEKSFYNRPNVVEIARDLVGKYLCSQINGEFTSGRIIETEAYDRRLDRASHAFGRQTDRTKMMYEKAGRAYVYLCYGIHQMFNVVTNEVGFADAILIRAIEPIVGRTAMIRRLGKDAGVRAASGPGLTAKAMGFSNFHNGIDLTGDEVWIESASNHTVEITADRRVGIDYAGEDALLPWRFFIKDDPALSKLAQKPFDDHST